MSNKTPGSFHHLIDYRDPPSSLIALRTELGNHVDIAKRAINGRTFEECLAIIAAELRIVLDGFYDVPDLCDVLVTALKAKSTLLVADSSGFVDSSRYADARLLPARIVETANAIRLENAGLIIPEAERERQIEEQAKAITQDAIAKGELPILNKQELDTAINGSGVWRDFPRVKPPRTGWYETKFAGDTYGENYWDGISNEWQLQHIGVRAWSPEQKQLVINEAVTPPR